uniref:pentapeptide repeat-containing protein n=1 Tax=Anaerotruncus colihominis TaxID=169435 RepID=UPI001A9BDA73
MNIKDILDKHAAWLRGEPEGVKADLSGADLSGADLSGANLSGANLSKVLNIDTLSWDSNTAFYPLQCPETGTYTAYKKANNLIVEL